MRKHLTTAIKFLVTAAGLIIVVRTVDISAVFDYMIRAEWRWLLVAFVLIQLSLGLRAFRWRLLLDGLGARVNFRRLVEIYYIGNFFNAVLPAGLGGDAVRIIEVTQDVPADVGAGTVIVDRLTGLMMQFLILLAALPFRPAGFPETLFWALLGMALMGLSGGVVLLEGRLIRQFGGWLPGPLSPVGSGLIAKILRAVQGCGWTAVFKAMGVSLLFNFMLFSWWTATGRSLGYTVPYSYFVLVVPVMSVALLLPSFGGLGTREVLAPILFAGAGLDSDQAVALALLVFASLRISSIVGAVVYIYTLVRDRRRPQTTA